MAPPAVQIVIAGHHLFKLLQRVSPVIGGRIEANWHVLHISRHGVVPRDAAADTSSVAKATFIKAALLRVRNENTVSDLKDIFQDTKTVASNC